MKEGRGGKGGGRDHQPTYNQMPAGEDRGEGGTTRNRVGQEQQQQQHRQGYAHMCTLCQQPPASLTSAACSWPPRRYAPRRCTDPCQLTPLHPPHLSCLQLASAPSTGPSTVHPVRSTSAREPRWCSAPAGSSGPPAPAAGHPTPAMPLLAAAAARDVEAAAAPPQGLLLLLVVVRRRLLVVVAVVALAGLQDTP